MKHYFVFWSLSLSFSFHIRFFSSRSTGRENNRQSTRARSTTYTSSISSCSVPRLTRAREFRVRWRVATVREEAIKTVSESRTTLLTSRVRKPREESTPPQRAAHRVVVRSPTMASPPLSRPSSSSSRRLSRPSIIVVIIIVDPRDRHYLSPHLDRRYRSLIGPTRLHSTWLVSSGNFGMCIYTRRADILTPVCYGASNRRQLVAAHLAFSARKLRRRRAATVIMK